MSVLDRIQRWKNEDAITAQQHALFTGLVRDEPFSLFSEINVLFGAGVLAFVLGLGWTVSTFSRQLGDILIVVTLSAIVVGCLWYCFARATAWSAAEATSANTLTDYLLYLCCLVWSVELGYLEQRFQLLAAHWDVYLLVTAVFFFLLAYRFDNRLVLSLALSSLAAWFGIAFSPLRFSLSGPSRPYALLFCALTLAAGALLRQRQIKPHFFNTYLNVVANVLFVALLSGVFGSDNRAPWVFALLAAGAASLAWGIRQREFVFVAYASVYTYIGLASLMVRSSFDAIGMLMLFVVTAVAMLGMLVVVSRRFGRTQ